MKKVDDNLKIESNNSIKLKIQNEKVYYSGNVKKKQKKLFSYTQERGLIINLKRRNFIIRLININNFNILNIYRIII